MTSVSEFNCFSKTPCFYYGNHCSVSEDSGDLPELLDIHHGPKEALDGPLCADVSWTPGGQKKTPSHRDSWESDYLFSLENQWPQEKKFSILPLFFVFVAPSGAGKTSLRRALLQELPNLFFSISATSRPQKNQEKHGRDYWFLSPEDFQHRLSCGHFMEAVENFGHHYGTPKPWLALELLQEHRRRNPSESSYEGFLHGSKHHFKNIPQDILMDTDHQGAIALKKIYGHRLTTVFILPPNFQILEKRLRQRNRDDEESLKKRLHQAHQDIHCWPHHDYVIVNKDFGKSLQRLKIIIEGKRLQRSCQDGSLHHFVGTQYDTP